MNKRELRLEEYGISGKRYKELCGFCEQYPEWKKIFATEGNTLRSVAITDMPITHGNSDQTGNAAIRLNGIGTKIDLVERTAKESCGEYAKFMIKAVCYEVPVNYLIAYEGMTMSKSSFYRMRRLFFFTLDKNKKY